VLRNGKGIDGPKLDKSDEISCILKEIFKLEEKLNEIVFKDTKKEWQTAA
jgi:hypothetical protein